MQKQDNTVFVAELALLPEMLSWVRSKAGEAGFTSGVRQKIEVSLEELLVNIISYAYKEKAGTLELAAAWVRGEYLELTLKDRGQAFDPSQHNSDIDPGKPIEERSLGGLGIHIAKEFMDEMYYKRDGVYNILTLRKYCNAL